VLKWSVDWHYVFIILYYRTLQSVQDIRGGSVFTFRKSTRYNIIILFIKSTPATEHPLPIRDTIQWLRVSSIKERTDVEEKQ
jgi:hypothetical protein